MNVRNQLRIHRWEEPIGSDTGLGVGWQKFVEITGGEIEVDLTARDFHRWLESYVSDETDFQRWLADELATYDLGVKVTQVCIDGCEKDGDDISLLLSVEDYE